MPPTWPTRGKGSSNHLPLVVDTPWWMIQNPHTYIHDATTVRHALGQPVHALRPVPVAAMGMCSWDGHAEMSRMPAPQRSAAEMRYEVDSPAGELITAEVKPWCAAQHTPPVAMTYRYSSQQRRC